MAKRNKDFNLGKVDKIRYKSPSLSWSIKVPKPKPGRLDYCQQKLHPSPNGSALSNLARKIPNADVFAYYKSAFNRWTKALSKYPDYAGTSVLEGIPYQDYYFKSCESITGAWKVTFRDDGTRDWGIDTENSGADITIIGGGNGNSGTGGSGNNGGDGGYISNYYECLGIPVIILEDGTEIDVGLESDTNITCYEQQIVCANGGCTPGQVYIPYDGISSLGESASGRITYPASPESETNGYVYQLTGQNISFTLEEDFTNPVPECAGNCNLSTDYGTGQGIAVIKWGDGKSFSTTDLPLTFTIEPITSSTSYQHTWQLPEGCTELTEFNTSDPVSSYTLDKVAEEITSSGSASEAVGYCIAPEKGKLSWDVNSGTVSRTTLNSPIEYQLDSITGGVQVDWGGGDIDILTGETWTVTDLYPYDLSYYYDDLCNDINDGTNTLSLTGTPPFSFVSLDYSNPIGNVTSTINVRFYYDNQCGVDDRYIDDTLDSATVLPIASFNVVYSNYNPVCGGGGGRRSTLEYTDSLGVARSKILIDNSTSNAILSDFTFSSTPPVEDCTNGYKKSELTYLDSLGVERTITLVDNSTATHQVSSITFPRGYKVETDTLDVSQRDTDTEPIVSLAESSYELIITDSSGEIGTYLYAEEPINFTYQCLSETTNGWKLNFQPQNVSVEFGVNCKPTNIVINQKAETDCCFTRSVSGGKTKWIDVSAIHNPPTTDCSALGAFSACSLPDFTQVGFVDLGGGVYQSLVKSDDEVVTDTCTAKSKLSIFANGSLVKEEIVCGTESDLLDTLSITSADQIDYTLTIFINGVQADQITYQDYNPTSNAQLFYIEQFPYCDILSTDDEGNSTQYYLSDDVRYVCRTRVSESNDINDGPYNVEEIDNGDGTYTIIVRDANGNIISSTTYNNRPSINGSDPNSPIQIDTTNQEAYLTCTCPDHDRKIYYYDQSKQDEGYIDDWSGDNSAGAPNILGTRCCKHVFSVLNQLGVADKYIPEDFPADPVPEKYQDPALIGDVAIKSLKPNDINRFNRKFK